MGRRRAQSRVPLSLIFGDIVILTDIGDLDCDIIDRDSGRKKKIFKENVDSTGVDAT